MAKKPVLKVITNPQLDKPANGNTPKPKSAKPSPITFDEKPGRFTKAGQKGPKAPPQKAATTKPIKTNAPQDARKIWDSQVRKGAKPKPSSITFGEKPQGASNRFTSKLGQKAAKPAAKAATTTASTVGRSLGVGVKVGIKALGAVALPLDMIANAKPTGDKYDANPEGPLMKGNASVGGGRRQAAGTPFAKAAEPPKMQGSMTAVPDKKPFNSSASDAYRGPNRGTSQRKPTQAGMPKASGSESVGPKKAAPSHGGGGFPSAAPAASTSSPGFSKGSTKAPAYVAPGPATKRGGVESRYQRDDIAMNSRKRAK